jgi:hypothetical protein
MLWKKILGGMMIAFSAITCPCHLPVVLPLLAVLLAGTPAAVLIAKYTGWVYGVMTVLFALTLGLGFQWTNQPTAAECDPQLPNTVNRSMMQITPKGVERE